jgi:hypothetical protein
MTEENNIHVGNKVLINSKEYLVMTVRGHWIYAIDCQSKYNKLKKFRLTVVDAKL